MKKIHVIFASLRPSFLILTPSCVALGAATAYASAGSISIVKLILVLAGSVAAHAAVNSLNEYADFKSGLDLETERTPFSGGSGALPAHPEHARSVLITALMLLVLSAGIGIFFVMHSGWILLLLWGFGILLAGIYSPWLTRAPLSTLLAPGAGFGCVMVCSAHYILAGSLSFSAAAASMVPFFLVNNLLLLNQFPDVEPDRRAGRKNFPLLFGRRAAGIIYAAFSVCAVVSLFCAVSASLIPALSLCALAPLSVSLLSARGALRFADDIPKLIPYMGMNVAANILTPAVMAAGILLG